MIIRVKLFAAARQLTNCDEIAVQVADGAIVADLRREITEQSPKLIHLVNGSRLAVDGEYVSDNAPLSAESEVALIPPVSGG